MEINKSKNNIFKFATKELSQDAFIAWLINSINGEDIELKKLSQEFLLSIIDNKHEEWKELIKKYDKNKCSVNIEVQFYNIDVLVIIHNKEKDQYLIIIIEDKVETLEHDEQIKKYKNTLKQNIEKRFNGMSTKINDKNILTCYYKIYDESNLEKMSVDKVYKRGDILKLMRPYSNIKHVYFKEYLEYLETIENCAKYYNDDSICDEMIAKKKYDIKYLAFFDKLEEIYTESYIDKFSEKKENVLKYYGNIILNNEISEEKSFEIKECVKERVYYGIDSSGNSKTWWCNIPIDFRIKSNVFNQYAFIKINFYEHRYNTVMLKISKIHKNVGDKKDYENINESTNNHNKIEMLKYYDEKSNKYYNIYNYYDSRVFENIDIYNEVVKILKNSLNVNKNQIRIEDKCFEIKRAGKGSTKTQPEINILTITIDKGNFKEQIRYIKEIIEKLKNNLTGRNIEINSLDDTNKLNVKKLY